MRKFFLLGIFALTSLFNSASHAQINLNVNIGSQPLWGPTGYDHVDSYYLPDVDSYYSVPKQQFTYLNNGTWVSTNSLPSRYQNYNLYNGYKVVVNGDRPYLNYNNDKLKYAKYKNWGGKQAVIKNSTNKKYYVVKGHPHGMPPGQAKKLYTTKGSVASYANGKGGSKGQGKGKGKH